MTNNPLPHIILPEQSGLYKVVQFNNNNHSYLRFGQKPGKDGDFHEFILERFAKEINVKCIPLPFSTLPDTQPYKMIGAGYCNINLEAKIAEFSGQSHDYKIGINQTNLRRLRTELSDWRINYLIEE